VIEEENLNGLGNLGGKDFKSLKELRGDNFFMAVT
jgi:hypothetical protein